MDDAPFLHRRPLHTLVLQIGPSSPPSVVEEEFGLSLISPWQLKFLIPGNPFV